MFRNYFHCACARTALRFTQFIFSLALIAAVAVSTTASAGLMSYDVKLTGSMSPDNGTNIEQYAATNIDPNTLNNMTLGANVPNTISPTPNPNPFASAAAHVIRSRTPVFFTDSFVNQFNREVWLLGPTDPTDLFVNNLDLSKLVEVELKFRFDNLPALEKVVVSDVKLSNLGNIPAQSVEVLSGVGSVASPLHLLIKFNAVDVNNSDIKIQFDYTTMVVPEPATLALVGLAGLGILGLFRSRRS